jgi:hypothetical protein
VTGLLPGERGAVAGVVVTAAERGEGKTGETPIKAELVVDAGGRGSRMPEWLEALGYDRPAETVISARLGYSTRIYRRASDRLGGYQGLFVQAAPPAHPRAGVVMPLEGERWIVTLAGGGGEYPPTDERGFLEFARGLRTPMLYETIRDAEPLSPIAGTRSTENRRRQFEQMARWPERLVVLGDAACAFNPVYGQGMSTAAMGVMTLDRCLREQARRGDDLTGLGRRFQRELAKVNATPWMLATGEDYRYRGVEGAPPDRATRFMHRYVDEITRLSTRNPEVRAVFLEVFNLLAPPTTLFRPGLLLRVVSGIIRHRGAGGAVAAAEEPEREESVSSVTA